MIKYCIFSIFCFLPFLIWADELPQLGKAPLEKVIQAMTVDEKIRLLTGTGEVAEDILVAVGETDKFAGQLGLRPVMTLKTTVSTIKVYEPGTSVSYGRRFVTDRTTRMGVVPYGYADGFFRCLSDRWQMMTAEGPAPQRGRICMDMCMIDLTDRPSVDVGDEVEIFGPDNSVNDMAEQAGTIPYELTCAVSKRVPRIYLRQGQEIARELLLRF